MQEEVNSSSLWQNENELTGFNIHMHFLKHILKTKETAVHEKKEL